MKVSDFWPEKWLKPEHLSGKTWTLTISAVTAEEVADVKDRQKRNIYPALSFAKASKKLILNKTQALAIQEIAGTEEMERWIGIEVALAPAKAPNGKDTIKISAAPKAAPAAPPEKQEQPAAPPKKAPAAKPAAEEAPAPTPELVCISCNSPMPAGDTGLICPDCLDDGYDEEPDESLGHDHQDD